MSNNGEEIQETNDLPDFVLTDEPTSQLMEMGDLVGAASSNEIGDAQVKEEVTEALEGIQIETTTTTTTESETQEKEQVGEPTIEVDEAKETEQNSAPSSQDSSQSPSSPDKGMTISLLATALREGGVLGSLTDEKIEALEDADSFVELFSSELQARELDDLNAHQKEYVKSLRNGVPSQVIQEHQHNTSVLDQVTDTELDSNVELRKQLIVHEGTSKGYSLSRAEAIAQRSVDMGTDLEESKSALEALKQIDADRYQVEVEKAEALRVESEDKNKEYRKSIEDNVESINDNMKFININATTKTKILSSITTPVKHTESGQIVNELTDRFNSDPEFVVRAHALYVITDGFKNFDKIKKDSKSTAVKELTKQMNRTTKSMPSTGVSSEPANHVSPDLMGAIGDLLKR